MPANAGPGDPMGRGGRGGPMRGSGMGGMGGMGGGVFGGGVMGGMGGMGGMSGGTWSGGTGRASGTSGGMAGSGSRGARRGIKCLTWVRRRHLQRRVMRPGPRDRPNRSPAKRQPHLLTLAMAPA